MWLMVALQLVERLLHPLQGLVDYLLARGDEEPLVNLPKLPEDGSVLEPDLRLLHEVLLQLLARRIVVARASGF